MWLASLARGVQQLRVRSVPVFVDDHVSAELAANCSVASLLGGQDAHVRRGGSRHVLQTHDVAATLARLSDEACALSAAYHPVRPRYARGFYCADPYLLYQQHVHASRVAEAWPATAGGGEGVRVVVVDDGVEDHFDIRVSERYLSGGAGGHGTSVAGVAAGYKNGLGVCGVAPASTVVDVRLLSQSFVSDVEEALAFEDEHAGWLAVYCSAWGPVDDGRCEGVGPLLAAALEAGVRAGRGGRGCIYVWAGGNGGRLENMNADGYANSPYTIAVGAMEGDAPAGFTEWGAALTVATSGVQVLTLQGASGFAYFYGTSAAAALAAGVVALMLGENADLGWRDVQEVLMLSAAKVGQGRWTANAAGRWYHYALGAGKLRADVAVRLAKRWENLPRRLTAAASSRTILPLPALVALPVATSFRVEHVEVCVSVTYPGVSVGSGAKLGVWVASPAGTRAILAQPTERVSVVAGCSLHDWCFTSLVQWSEESAGVWTVHVSDASASQVLNAVELKVHGSRPEAEAVACA